MKFEVLSDVQLEELKCLPAGIWDFEVIHAEERERDAGGEMTILQLLVDVKPGISHVVFCYLIPSSRFAFLIKHFWDSVGNPEKYESGDIPASEYIGKKGRMKTKVGKNKEGDAQAQVVDFIKKDDLPDDDISF